MNLDRIRRLRDHLPWNPDEDEETEPMGFLRAAAAQLLVATGAEATLEQSARFRRSARLGLAEPSVPKSLVWAPALIGPLAGLAHLEHTRRPSEKTAAAVRILDLAAIAAGGALFLFDLAVSEGKAPSRLGALAFASAGLVGVSIERQEKDLRRTERELRRRADIVERLVPRRKPKLDRVVVHV
jgi:hypothetical protein